MIKRLRDYVRDYVDFQAPSVLRKRIPLRASSLSNFADLVESNQARIQGVNFIMEKSGFVSRLRSRETYQLGTRHVAETPEGRKIVYTEVYGRYAGNVADPTHEIYKAGLRTRLTGEMNLRWLQEALPEEYPVPEDGPMHFDGPLRRKECFDNLTWQSRWAEVHKQKLTPFPR